MKKSIYSVAVAIVAGLFVSCGVSAPKANLEGASKVDSLSYAIGVAQTQGLKNYLVARMGMDTIHMSQFVEGLLEATNADEKQNAYFAGTQIGQQVVNQIIPDVTMQILAGKGAELNKKNFTEAFIAGVTEKGLTEMPAEVRLLMTKISASSPASIAALAESNSQFVPGNTGIRTLGFATLTAGAFTTPFV